MGVGHLESAAQHSLSQKAKKEKSQAYDNEYIKFGFASMFSMLQNILK